MILHLGTDLMMASALGAAARTAGVRFRSVTSANGLLTALASEPACQLIVVNLQTPGLEVSTLAEELKRLPMAVPETIWFAQHVYEDLLAEATACGIGRVMTRGQLNARLDQLAREAGTGAVCDGRDGVGS